MNLTISTRRVSGIAILDLEGSITLGAGAVVLRDAVRYLLAEGVKGILLNMAGVDYIDSGGNGELVSAYTTARSMGGSLKFLKLPKKVHDLFQINKLYTVYEVFDDEQKAVEAFKAIRYRCVCPMCDEIAMPGLSQAVPFATQSCGRCRLHFAVSHFDFHSMEFAVRSLTMQTYVEERVELMADAFFNVSIIGRLDLFASSTLTKLWNRLPEGQKVLIDLSRTLDIDDDGWKQLFSLVSNKAKHLQAAVSLENVDSHFVRDSSIAPPFYAELSAAREALGNGTLKNRSWQVRALIP